MILFAFVSSLVFFLGIGLWSVVRSRGTAGDYYLASRSVSPLFVGLSAIATNNSGYMFIGVIGYTYTTGLPAIWLMIGWILGDFLASLLLHSRLRQATEKTSEVSFAGVLSTWNGTDWLRYRRLAAIVTIIFLGAYASAQFNAGGKALTAMFGWEAGTGAVLVAGIVLLYCIAGGLRA